MERNVEIRQIWQDSKQIRRKISSSIFPFTEVVWITISARISIMMLGFGQSNSDISGMHFEMLACQMKQWRMTELRRDQEWREAKELNLGHAILIPTFWKCCPMIHFLTSLSLQAYACMELHLHVLMVKYNSKQDS